MKLLILCIAVIAVSHQVAGKPAMMSAESSFSAYTFIDNEIADLINFMTNLKQITSDPTGIFDDIINRLIQLKASIGPDSSYEDLLVVLVKLQKLPLSFEPSKKEGIFHPAQVAGKPAMMSAESSDSTITYTTVMDLLTKMIDHLNHVKQLYPMASSDFDSLRNTLTQVKTFIDPDTSDATLSDIYATLLQIIGGELPKTLDSEEKYEDADPRALQKFLTINYYKKCLTPGNGVCYQRIVKPYFLDSSKCKTSLCLDTVSLAQRAVKRGCYNLSIDCRDLVAANDKLIQRYHG